MGWETRGGSGPFFYRKKRVGGRVVSEYVGRGEVAELLALLEGSDREERTARREAERAERERLEGEERDVADWFERVELLADAAMLAAGFAKRKGEWRRRGRGRTD